MGIELLELESRLRNKKFSTEKFHEEKWIDFTNYFVSELGKLTQPHNKVTGIGWFGYSLYGI